MYAMGLCDIAPHLPSEPTIVPNYMAHRTLRRAVGTGMRTILQQRGFTLMEMIVTVATMLVISAVATPVASSFYNEYQFTGEVERFAFEISRARMQAVAQNTNVRVRVTSTGYVREKSSNGINWTTQDSAISWSSGTSATASDAGSPRFGSNGLATTSTDVTVTRGSTHKTIHTSVVGRVTIS
jgi:prepilin-type N-terminal cleavage/methylation domain-containing protein